MNPLLLLVIAATLLGPRPLLAQPQVLASIKPLQLIASAVTDGVSSPSLLIAANQSPHDVTLRPSDVRKLAEAELLLWVGPEMETYLANIMARTESRERTLQAVSLPGIRLHESGTDSAHGHEEDDGHFHDPHIWLDTGNALVIARHLAETLGTIDPQNRARYERNVQAFGDSIRQLEQRVQERINAVPDPRYAVYHNGIQYFEKQFGLHHEFVMVPDHEIQPGVKHILAMREMVVERQPVCVLEDISASDATISTVFRNHPIVRVRIDTMGDAVAPGPAGYATLIDNLAEAIGHCLQE